MHLKLDYWHAFSILFIQAITQDNHKIMDQLESVSLGLITSDDITVASHFKL